MKRLTKKLWVFVMVLSLVLSANSIASAATYRSTGLEDGLYEASTEPNEKVMNTYFKMTVIIEGGKVSTGSFELRVKDYPTAITSSFAAYAPTQETKDFITNTCPEVEDYAAQLINKGDGALVTKYSKAVKDSKVLDTFKQLWKDVVKQAGGKIAEDTVKAKSVSLNKKTASLTVGKTVNLVATVKPSNAKNKEVVWSSSDKKVAKVDSKGKVTAVAKGTATITAKTKDGSFKAACKVTVKAK
jgi:uncharacterized protein YjdB